MNKYKKLAFNTIVFAIGNFGSKILVLLLTRLYTKHISPTDMNTKELLETTALFLQPIFTFALQEYLIRFGLDKKYSKKAVFSTSVCITAVGLAGVILIVPGLRFIPFLRFISGNAMLLALYVAMSSVRMLFQQFVRSRDMVKLFSLDGILATLMLFVFNVIFIAHLGMGVKGFMISVILSDLCSSIFLFSTAKLGGFFRPRYFSAKLAKAMMRFALPLIPTIVMWTVTSLSDRLFITNMHSTRVELGEDTAGLYAVANKIPNLLSMVSTIFFQAWNMSAINENDSKGVSKFYERVYSAYESILFIASAGLLMLIKPVSSFLTNSSNYAEYGTIYIYTPVLIMAVVFMSLNQFLSGIYNAKKLSKNSFWTSVVACSVNLVMNFFLIPEWGLQGAALATFLSYYICYWARMIDSRYYVPFKFNAVRSVCNTAIVALMSWLIITVQPLWQMWTVVLFAVVLVLNSKALLLTLKKVIRK
ncbi:MAG: polysaccharide biosynthesis C-terminal domain-containing protein [Ruminococcus flavefaciens]|nr:polysaccharide biosynthesis C-terminal domain-containing protein [Ruminococcus flavefaciens]MCM1228610.1 polysaccharide biosynthesis C-terminal domain-containing protein [Ruminococcus flavefaciens]